ncbi:hypothetical protein EON80_20885 [bacterium]|nr:MAG: hypothetical protein EON80_20885 [bacterium]
MSLSKHSNPVWDDYCADPFVLKHDDLYYCYGTSGSHEQPGLNGRKFILLRSKDLVNWEQIGGALIPAKGNENGAHWAPEVAYANGKFWMYYSASQSGDDGDQHLRVAFASTPEGPFEDLGEMLPDEGFCIDPSPFQDPQSGKWYLYFCKDYFDGRVGSGTAVVELADDMQTTVGDLIPLVRADSDWQIYERNRFHMGQQWEAWHQ